MVFPRRANAPDATEDAPNDAPDPIERFIGCLSAAGHVDAAQLRRANRVADETDDRLDTVLRRLSLVGEAVIADAWAAALDLPRVAGADIDVDPARVEALGARFLAAAHIAPLAPAPDAPEAGLRLAMADPLDEGAVNAIRLKLGGPVERAVAAPSEIDAALERAAGGESSEIEAMALDGEAIDTAEDVEKLRDLAAEAPVVRIVNQIIRRAVEARASDIHIEPFERRLRVRLRVDGLLREIDAPPPHLRAAVISRIKIMAKLNIAEQRLPQDGRIQATALGRELDMRVATVPTLHGEGVVMRLLDRSGLILDFDGLGFDADIQMRLRDLIERPNGVLLVTGPTGSGKTTTLYAAIAQLNAPERKIVTIEDPVEYQLPGVPQIQVKNAIGLTFASGLRSILRQDPDVIMVGEIRDLETAQIAVQAALTGHLVLATLHTNSAAAAVNRLRDMGIEDYLITATLVGVVGQRLLRRLCLSCARPEDASLAAQIAPLHDPTAFKAPVGCPDCRGSGFRGRSAIVEILSMDADLRRAVIARDEQAELERLAIAGGMRTLRGHGIARAAAGETALTEVLRVANEV